MYRLRRSNPVLLLALALICVSATGAGEQYPENPFVIETGLPPPDTDDSAGGIIVADANHDGALDYLVTVRGHVACFSHDGAPLWHLETAVRVDGSSEGVGLPGHHGPGVTAGDIDGDDKTEVLFLTQDSVLHVLDGATGTEEWTAKPPHPEGTDRWEHLIIANFRGKGDRDLLLQTTNADGYRMGRYLAAYALEDLQAGKIEPLWSTDGFLACAHNGARIADLDGDGRDEVLGGTLLDPDGKLLYTIPLKGHIDSIFAADVCPDVPGLELIALEEGGGNRVFCYGTGGLLWEAHHEHTEPQNAALGDFDPERPGLEVWCRSRYDTHQKPFVFDAQGTLISTYEMDHVAPEGWTDKGVEVINTVHWDGGPRQYAAAKERHESGDICLFDGISGRFALRLPEEAARFFVADVSGDWREELIVLHKGNLHVYHNPEPNPRPEQPSLWVQPHYQRSKMTYNYYSP